MPKKVAFSRLEPKNTKSRVCMNVSWRAENLSQTTGLKPFGHQFLTIQVSSRHAWKECRMVQHCSNFLDYSSGNLYRRCSNLLFYTFSRRAALLRTWLVRASCSNGGTAFFSAGNRAQKCRLWVQRWSDRSIPPLLQLARTSRVRS